MAKKRCNGEGSINKRKDGRWECSIMFGFQKDGRRRRKSFYGRTRKEALDKIHDFKQKAVEAFNKAFLGHDPGSSQIPVGA